MMTLGSLAVGKPAERLHYIQQKKIMCYARTAERGGKSDVELCETSVGVEERFIKMLTFERNYITVS